MQKHSFLKLKKDSYMCVWMPPLTATIKRDCKRNTLTYFSYIWIRQKKREIKKLPALHGSRSISVLSKVGNFVLSKSLIVNLEVWFPKTMDSDATRANPTSMAFIWKSTKKKILSHTFSRISCRSSETIRPTENCLSWNESLFCKVQYKSI